MGWFAFAVAVAASFFIWWQLWRRWIQPTRDLQALIEEVTAEKMPRLHSNNLPAVKRSCGREFKPASLGCRQLSARSPMGWSWRTGSGAFA